VCFYANSLFLYADSENVDEDNSGFDAQSSSTIKLNNSTVLYLREVNRHLAMVCILRTESFERQGLIPLPPL